MEKKAFSIFFTDQEESSAAIQLVNFINKHQLNSTDYHLIALSRSDSGGLSSWMDITCIYHADKELH